MTYSTTEIFTPSEILRLGGTCNRNNNILQFFAQCMTYKSSLENSFAQATGYVFDSQKTIERETVNRIYRQSLHNSLYSI